MILAAREVVRVQLVHDVGPAVGGGRRDDVPAEERCHHDEVIGVDGPHRVVEPVVVGALLGDVGAVLAVVDERLVDEVVPGDRGVALVPGRDRLPDVDHPVLVGGAGPESVGIRADPAAAPPWAATAGHGVQVEQHVHVALVGLVDEPVNHRPRVGLPGAVEVEQLGPADRQPDHVHPHGLEVVEVRLLDPGLLMVVDDRLGRGRTETLLVSQVHRVVVVVQGRGQLADGPPVRRGAGLVDPEVAAAHGGEVDRRRLDPTDAAGHLRPVAAVAGDLDGVAARIVVLVAGVLRRVHDDLVERLGGAEVDLKPLTRRLRGAGAPSGARVAVLEVRGGSARPGRRGGDRPPGTVEESLGGEGELRDRPPAPRGAGLHQPDVPRVRGGEELDHDDAGAAVTRWQPSSSCCRRSR